MPDEGADTGSHGGMRVYTSNEDGSGHAALAKAPAAAGSERTMSTPNASTSGTGQSQDPAALEQTMLAQLTADEQAMQARWAAARNTLMSSQDLYNQLLDMQQWEQRLVGYQPTAAYLQQQGRPQFGNRLAYVLADLRQAIQIVAQTQQNAVQQEWIRFGIQANANTFGFSVMNRVAQNRAAAGMAAAQGADNVINGYPPYPYGVYGVGYCAVHGMGRPCPYCGW